MRYVYGITTALLLGGTVATLTVGPVGAQTAQNEPGAIAATTPRPGAPMSFADLAARLQPAVVNISTKQSIEVSRNPGLPPGFEEFFRRFGGRAPQTEGGDNTITQRGGSLGSGFIISPDGYIVTNNHVISPARDGATVDSITVTLTDRKEYEAELVGRDAAARAGIEQGDVVITVNGRPVTPDETLSYLVSSQPVGSRVPVELIRNGQRRTVTLVVAERPTEEELAQLGGGGEAQIEEQPTEEQTTSQRSARESLGVTVQTLTPEVARTLRLSDTNVRGVVIASIDPSSDAAAEGLRTGDIILSINQRATPTPEAAAAAVEAARSGGRNSVLLLIRRGNAPPLYVGVDLVST